MCMITYLPSGIAVPRDEIENGGTWNDDGHGWAIAAELGNMIVGKSMSLTEALEQFTEARERHPYAPALFHSRWATHGSKTTANVHPFPVTADSVLAHNGVMPSAFHPDKDDDRSDTRVFADLLGRDTDGLFSKRYRKRIGAMIGSGNKLVILSVNPRFLAPKGWIINENRGEWDRATGAWFSNGDYYARWDRHWTPKSTAIGTGHYLGSASSGTVILGSDDGSKSSWGDAGNKGYGPWSEEWREYVANNECPVCWSYGRVDHKTGFCTFCECCIDCGEAVGDCFCYIPNSAFKGGDPDEYDSSHSHAVDSREVSEYLDRGRGVVAPWGDFC